MNRLVDVAPELCGSGGVRWLRRVRQAISI